MGCEDFRCRLCGGTFSPILMSPHEDVCEYCEAKGDTPQEGETNDGA